MTDTYLDPNPAEPCTNCHEAPGTMESLCAPCYWAAIDHELSCDWLDNDTEATR